MHGRAQDCQGGSSQPHSQAGKKSLRMLFILSLRKLNADAVDEVVAGVAVAAARAAALLPRWWRRHGQTFPRCLLSLRHPRSLAPLLHCLYCPHHVTKAEQARQNGIQQRSASQARNIDREIRRIQTRKAYYQAFWGLFNGLI